MLTAIALPVKDMRVETIAERMLEILGRTGIPKKMLSDQGQQFVGKKNQQLCKRLQTQNIDISPTNQQLLGIYGGMAH